MKLIPLPALQDDCLWLLHDGQPILVTRAVTQLRRLASATKRHARVLVHYAGIRQPDNEFR
jgi:hypothetical protein